MDRTILAFVASCFTLVLIADSEPITAITNVVKNSHFLPDVSLHVVSRQRRAVGFRGWKVSRGGAFFVHDKNYYHHASLDDKTVYNITATSHSIGIPQVPGRTLSQALDTKTGFSYKGNIVLTSPTIRNAILVSATDASDGSLLFSDFFKERMAPVWSLKKFEFVAKGIKTILTISAVACEEITSPSSGVYIGKIEIFEGEVTSGVEVSPGGNGNRKLLTFIDLDFSTPEVDNSGYLAGVTSEPSIEEPADNKTSVVEDYDSSLTLPAGSVVPDEPIIAIPEVKVGFIEANLTTSEPSMEGPADNKTSVEEDYDSTLTLPAGSVISDKPIISMPGAKVGFIEANVTTKIELPGSPSGPEPESVPDPVLPVDLSGSTATKNEELNLVVDDGYLGKLRVDFSVAGSLKRGEANEELIPILLPEVPTEPDTVSPPAVFEDDMAGQVAKASDPAPATLAKMPTKNFIDPSLLSIAVSYNAENVRISESTVAVSVCQHGGSRWQTKRFGFGYFQSAIQCPRGAPLNIITRFHLGVENPFYNNHGLGFEFDSKDPRSVRATFLDAKGLPIFKQISFDFDCSTSSHLFAISWDEKSFGWFIDNALVHSLELGEIKSLTSQPMFLFGSILQYSTPYDDQKAKWLENDAWQPVEKYVALFADISVAANAVHKPKLAGKVSPGLLVDPGSSSSAEGDILSPVIPEYCSYHCQGCSAEVPSDGSVTINLNSDCGSRFSSKLSYLSARVSADIRCPTGNTSGLVTSFYLSSQEGSGSRDEISWEFLGNQKTIVQSKYLVNGVEPEGATWHDLEVDCSDGFHSYAIEWSADRIIWSVDQKPVRVLTNTRATAGFPYPVKAMKLYGALWEGSNIDFGNWSGKKSPLLKDPSYTYSSHYQNIRVLSPV